MPIRTGKRGKRRAQGRREAPDRFSQAAPAQASGRVAGLFAAAAQHHKSGTLAEAEALYRQVLELNPDHVESLHNLGVLAQNSRCYEMAEALIGKAIAVNGRVAQLHQSLADTLRIQNKLEEATAHYRRAIDLQPNVAQAHFDLALALGALGKPDEAARSCRRAIALKPDFAEAHNNLGSYLRDMGSLVEAESSCRRAIALKPDFVQALYTLALVLSSQGRQDEAGDCLRRLVALKPDFAEAHNNLGNVLRTQGALDAAVGSYQRAIALRPDFAEAHYNLGAALQGQGDLAGGASSYRRAIALNPDFAAAHNNLGAVLLVQRDLDGAAASYQRAIDLRPDFPEAHYNLGGIRSDQGRLDEAASSYRRTIALKPEFAEAHNRLGSVLKDEAEASACYQRAIHLQPNLAEAHNNLGNVFLGRGRAQEAVVSFRRAADLDASRADIWSNLGRALAVLGELGDARAAMLRAVELDPQAPDVLHRLAELQPMNDGSTEGDATFLAVSRLADNLDQLPMDKRPPVMFAMAKALESRREFARAFAFMAQGNALIRASLSYDIGEDEKRMDVFAKIFDGPLLERLKGGGASSQRPIFILGMARSGSTLIEQILSAHPAVQGGGELPNLTSAIAGQRSRRRSSNTLNEADCRAIAETYLDGLPPPAASGQGRITDKAPSNFEYLGLIHLCLPNARIIHCQRDPRDVCLSCFGSLFRDGNRYAFDLVELGRYWRAYDRLMAHWRAVLPAGRIFQAPYEAVVEDVEAWARRLIAYCGLEWDDACLRFHESKREVHTASLAQVRQPIYASSVGRWRRFATHLRPLLDALGEPWSDEDFVQEK